MTTDHFAEAARAEAERQYPALNPDAEKLTYPRSALREHKRSAHIAGWEAARTHLAAQEPTPADSKISGYDLAVLRSTYQAFGTRDSEWGEGAQAGMRAAAAILGITIDKEDDQ